jgi:hypothetical protein
MSRRDDPLADDRLAWLLVIGRRLKADYDAIGQPLPPALAALLAQLEACERADDASAATPSRAEPADATSP